MSYQNGTPFLNLPQTLGTDHRDWFDENAANLNLDTKMKTLWDGAADTATILSELQELVASLGTDVSTLQNTVSGHTSTLNTVSESLVLINTTLNALNTQVTNKFDSVGIADAYDADHGIYAVDDVVTYNGQRYVCNTAIAAAEPFDVSKWTAEDVQTAIDKINSDLSVIVDVSNKFTTSNAKILNLAIDAKRIGNIVQISGAFNCSNSAFSADEVIIDSDLNIADFKTTALLYGGTGANEAINYYGGHFRNEVSQTLDGYYRFDCIGFVQ